ncbi:MAG TPA: asparaginase, partial [Gemmatimonadaceae bacterium]
MRYDLNVVATRGDIVESRHRVHAAIVDARGVLRGSAGDPSLITVCRSCAKPFPAMRFVASGGFDELGWGDDELALACASHG